MSEISSYFYFIYVKIFKKTKEFKEQSDKRVRSLPQKWDETENGLSTCVDDGFIVFNASNNF